MRTAVVLAATWSLVACAAHSPTSTAADAAPSTERVGSDPGTTTDAAAPGSRIDGGAIVNSDAGVTTPGVPAPPAGATLCGSGSFGAGDGLSECQAAANWFSPGFGADACGSASMTSGEWEAWCGPTTTFVRATFHDVRMTVTNCAQFSIAGFERDGTHGGTLGNGKANGYLASPSPSLSGDPTDVALWLTLDSASSTHASLYIAGLPDPLACKGEPTGPRLLLGANASWK